VDPESTKLVQRRILTNLGPRPCQRSELGGSWRRLSEKKSISCKKVLVCHVRVTVDLPTFCVVTIFSVESKELELELEQPKKSPSKKNLSKNLENTYRKNSINLNISK